MALFDMRAIAKIAIISIFVFGQSANAQISGSSKSADDRPFPARVISFSDLSKDQRRVAEAKGKRQRARIADKVQRKRQKDNKRGGKKGGILSKKPNASVASASPSSAAANNSNGNSGGTQLVGVDIDQLSRIDVDTGLAADDVSLLGDQVNMNSGSLSFSHLDVFLPGNSDLQVAVRRMRTQGWNFGNSSVANFGDWQLDVPNISVVTPLNVYEGPTQDATVDDPPQWTKQLCSTPRPGPIVVWPPSTNTTMATINDAFILDDRDYSNGLDLYVPGQGSKKVLYNPAGVSWPSGTIRVTSDYWALACTSANNGEAEGFVATSPDGTKYLGLA